MLGNTVYKTLEELSKGIGLSQLQHVLNSIISELGEYLQLEPLYKDIAIKLVGKEKFARRENESILDFGVRRVVQDDELIVEINEVHKKFLSFILLREAYYSFVDKEASELVKICINQIVENDLSGLLASKEWKKLIKDSLVNRDFIHSQFDKLQKFFKIEAREPFKSVTLFFFKDIRENPSLCRDNNIDRFYDIIFERYTYYKSKSLFNPEIMETLRILIQIFYETKSYLNFSNYQILFNKFKENKQIDTKLSLRKFTENMQWINKDTSIAPTYDINYGAIDYYPIFGYIKFNPLLEKNKIISSLEEWPFLSILKFSENGFATEIVITLITPMVYLNDFLNYFNTLEEWGYIKKKLYHYFTKNSILNLNYFSDISNVSKIIDPHHVKYEKNLEISACIDHTNVSHPYPFSLFDFILLDRVRNFSVTGLTFDKRIETLNFIKNDIENEIRKQNDFNKKFKERLGNVLNSPMLRQQFLKVLEKNKDQGFLYTYSQLGNILNYLDLIGKILDDRPEISNIHQLQTFLITNPFSQNIEEHLLIRNEDIKKIVFRDFLSLYFQSKRSFREEMEKIQAFYNVLDACYNLKILDLRKVKNIIKITSKAEEIYQKRKNRYDKVFKPLSANKITNEKVESGIEAFLNHDPPVAKPYLINTILTSTFAKYYPDFIVTDTPEVKKKLNTLKLYFPRMFIHNTIDLDSNRNLIYISIYFINIKEKRLLLSILYTLFKDSIISFKRYFWRGVMRLPRHNRRSFYDFEHKQFYYSEDIFKQLLIYSQKLLGDQLEWPEYPLNNSNVQDRLWSEEKNMDDLVEAVKYRISHQDIDFNPNELAALSGFIRNLETNLLDKAKLVDAKAKVFFKRYIKSIKFIPAFQKFGFSQYYLYFRPFYYKSQSFKIDFKLLFINSFQKIKYPACIEPNQPLFIEYIFPFRTPNKSYLNWLVKSKRNVSEYCLFYKKKFYDIIHFNRNLAKEGWIYSSIRFKSYMEDVLFNPTYNPEISGIREFDLSEISDHGIYGPDTQEFKDLTQIYNTHSFDMKSYVGTRSYSIINNITHLLEKKLIFPYVSLKNLDFQEKISIILPEIKENLNEKILKIFSFFNVCRIYEIEGEFFIYGFNKERVFENGLLIELWFPKCELDEFFNVFGLLFQYLGIKHYIILTDLVKGKTLLKSVYKNIDFLKEYNPLINLKWNDKDKIWMNHKLFTEKMKKIYPELIP